MTNNSTALNRKAPLALIALGALFGAAFLFMKVLVDEIAPVEIAAGRLALGALVVFAIVFARRRPVRLNPASVSRISLLALLDSVIPFTLVAWAETRIDSGVASVLVSTMPLFTVVIATTALPDESLAPVRMLGIPLGFLGVVTLTGGGVLDITSSSAAGQLAVVGAAACYGAAAVYARVLLKTEDALNLTATKLAAGAVMAALLVAVTQGTPAYGNLSIEGALSLAALGILSTALAFTLYFWLVGAAGSVYASLVTYVVPVFGLLLGWAVLGEEIGPGTALGAVLITGGVAAVMYGPAAQEWLTQAAAQLRGPALADAPALIDKEEYA
ncbi:MAG TPA: DMT family transporter [Dehalococcoidia bacterium]